ncbi:MAG TPA: hypothetical protein VFP12_12085 [Allosphingosinicella sp.]|nr:hypothetical protein [Allosphingosinicella sp.]
MSGVAPGSCGLGLVSGALATVGADGSELLMLASAFVDESYGDDGRLMLAGLIASWDKWRGFGIDWTHLLKQAEVPYAHFYEMDRNQGPFSDREVWGRGRKGAFIKAQTDIMRKWCELGVTVSIDLAAYKRVYREQMPPKVSSYSAYGVAGLEMVLCVQRHCFQLFSDADTINFVWERGHQNLPNVQEIFHDLKDCYGEKARSLGAFIPLSRTEAPPLCIVDQLCVSARRIEPEAKERNLFAKPPPKATLADIQAMLPPDETFPVFHHEIDEIRLAELRDLTVEIKQLRRGLRRGRAPR